MLKIISLARASSTLTSLSPIYITHISTINEFTKRFGYFQDRNRKLPINFSLKIEVDSTITASEYIEFLYCLNSCNLPITDQIKDLSAKLASCSEITLGAFTNILRLLRQNALKIDSNLEKIIIETFLKNTNSLKLIDYFFMAELLLLKILSRDNQQIYIEIEKFTMKTFNEMSYPQICVILRCFSAVIHQFPSDIHVKVEPMLAERVKDMTYENLLNVLSIYAGIQRTHHFLNLAKAASAKILADPSKFFNKSNGSFVLALHFFTKFREFSNINKLIPQYLPNIDERWNNCPNFLGMFILCIFRKPPSQEYKSLIIKGLFNHSDKLEFFRKKKIVISMIDDPNPEFWENVHKLKVYWNASEQVFLKSNEVAILKQHNLIRD